MLGGEEGATESLPTSAPLPTAPGKGCIVFLHSPHPLSGSEKKVKRETGL